MWVSFREASLSLVLEMPRRKNEANVPWSFDRVQMAEFTEIEREKSMGVRKVRRVIVPLFPCPGR